MMSEATGKTGRALHTLRDQLYTPVPDTDDKAAVTAWIQLRDDARVALDALAAELAAITEERDEWLTRLADGRLALDGELRKAQERINELEQELMMQAKYGPEDT